MPDYGAGPAYTPDYHFYPDRLETDYALLGEPRVQAMLGVIRDREGPAYNVVTGGKTFDDYSRHPNIKVGNSHAAGAYQMQPDTWEPIRRALHLPDFSPHSQDLAAVDLLHQKHITDRLLSDDPEGATLMAARPWTSLPSSAETKLNAAGKPRGLSYKKRHEVDTLDQVLADYWSRLR
jgi:muramidase (phage lysozyme)